MNVDFKQFRYFGKNSNLNNITQAQLINGTVFGSSVIQLGIRTLPGVKFYLNEGLDPVIVGYTGVFELDFPSSGGSISSIRFDANSIDFIDNNINGGYIIIDALGRGGN